MSGLVLALARSLRVAMMIGVGVSLAACGSGTAAGDGGGSATTAPATPSATTSSPLTPSAASSAVASSAAGPTVSLSAAPPVTPFGTATTASKPATLLTYSEAGGFTGTNTTIRITATGRLTMMKTGTKPVELARRLAPAELVRLMTLVNSTPLRGSCAHVIHPEAIIVTVAVADQKISCVDKLPAAIRPLQAEVLRLAR